MIRDAAQIADAVFQILNDSELRVYTSKNSNEKARQYRWNNVVDELEKIYRGFDRRIGRINFPLLPTQNLLSFAQKSD
jgi:glycosyltransferase involved in cell wall biosynthesis